MLHRVYSQKEVIDFVTPLLKKYRAEQAILFGSYARREADAQSDIDLLVIGGKQFDPTDVFCIADELHCLTGKEVDVYELCEVNADTDFYHTIFSEGVQIA
ncbi:MAG: nucleotidyltransferase domain-containing protein [Oscillospiraceae bacterium]|nr:nucleotidyltransferase domain-containing protein [Oscillospiraceae bacterium]